jgi:murein DD-endopeptidase MepM/ murein hydrolase activator NlpD
MSRRLRLLLGLTLALVAALPAGANARPAYLQPVLVGEQVFPVLRSNWYSVINFRDDWHAPRMRFERGRWRQIGVHEGNDVFAEPGTPIVSITGGYVENLGWQFYSGWRVGIRGDDGRYWFYAHLRRYATGLRPGQRVEPGTLLGEVGNTGYGNKEGHRDEFTYHLHLGIQEANGAWSDPYPLLRRLYEETVQT